jgi:hypothetical protein
VAVEDVAAEVVDLEAELGQVTASAVVDFAEDDGHTDCDGHGDEEVGGKDAEEFGHGRSWASDWTALRMSIKGWKSVSMLRSWSLDRVLSHPWLCPRTQAVQVYCSIEILMVLVCIEKSWVYSCGEDLRSEFGCN